MNNAAIKIILLKNYHPPVRERYKVTLKKTARQARFVEGWVNTLAGSQRSPHEVTRAATKEKPKAGTAGKQPEGHGLPEKSRVMRNRRRLAAARRSAVP